MANDAKDGPKVHPSERDRKLYQKPSVTSEPIYETLALACGKLPGQGASCNSAPRRS